MTIPISIFKLVKSDTHFIEKLVDMRRNWSVQHTVKNVDLVIHNLLIFAI